MVLSGLEGVGGGGLYLKKDPLSEPVLYTKKKMLVYFNDPSARL